MDLKKLFGIVEIKEDDQLDKEEDGFVITEIIGIAGIVIGCFCFICGIVMAFILGNSPYVFFVLHLVFVTWGIVLCCFGILMLTLSKQSFGA